VLEVLHRGQSWLRAPVIAARAGIYPIRQIYRDLSLYARWGLLERQLMVGRFWYRLTRRGRARLIYLQR
jgi:hypothetical protein